ncbi:MAG: hypothetical protein J5845_07435 [Lachnospiraceae bacterium]|nr:hypothetical protein [Lachnospiraceae bacterium]
MEIGQGMTRVVEIDYQVKSPKIYHAFSLETPKDMVQDGVITRNEDFIINLKAELRKRDIRTESLVFTVASSRIANREARIPLCKPKQILPLITANAADYFPVDMNQYHLVYNILGKTEEEGVKQYRLALLAVPNDVTTSYIDLARSLGMHIRAMDYVGNSIFQVVRQEVASGVNAIIKIDEHTSLVTIVKNGEIMLQRSVPHGVNGAIENVTELDVYGENLSYADATVVFTKERCLRRYLNVDVDYQEKEDTSDEMMMSRIMITENLRYFIGNVGRILEYFVSRNDNAAIENVYLVGIGADFVGMDDLLSNELGYKVQKYTGLDNIRTGSPNFTALESMRVYAAAIGASYAPLQLLSEDLLKGEKQTSLVLPIAIFIACAAIAATLFVVGRVSVTNAKKKNEDLKAEVERSKYVEQLKQAYEKASTTYNDIAAQLAITGSNDNRLLTQFINELEQKMPTGFKTIQLSADVDKGVTLDVICASKEEAATVFLQIRDFKTIIAVSASEFTETYGLRPEYDAILEKLLEKEIQEAIAKYEERADRDGFVLNDEGDKVLLEDLVEEKKQELLSEKKNEKIVLGRIVKAMDDEDEGKEKTSLDEIDPADFFYTEVKFTITCAYNPACDSKEYLSGIEEELAKEEKEREAEAERKAKEEAERQENAKEDAKADNKKNDKKKEDN